MRWEESPLSSTTPHFFPPKEKMVNVKKKKKGGFHPKRDPPCGKIPKLPNPHNGIRPRKVRLMKSAW